MNRVLLDTNAYVELMSGDDQVADILAKSGAVLLTPVVLGELFDGFAGGNRQKSNRDIFEQFRDKPRTLMVPITDQTAEWFALIKQQLKRKGRPIPINDVWIAASSMEHGAQLLSFDAHFENIEGLLMVPLGD